jgi:hypothetical protein
MLAVGLVLNFVGVSLFCWAILTLTVYALPLFIAARLGLAAFDSGAGVVGALVIGCATAALTLLSGQLVFAVARSLLQRGIVAVVFLVPAGVAGYHAGLGLSQFVVPSPFWREAFALIGVVFICRTAWMRLALFAAPRPLSGRAARSQPEPGLATATSEG